MERCRPASLTWTSGWWCGCRPIRIVRVDTNDYSLDPGLVGRRVEVRVSPAGDHRGRLDTGELACRHERTFAKHRTITALEHARALRARHARARAGLEVEVRPLVGL